MGPLPHLQEEKRMKLRDGATYFLSDAFFNEYPNNRYPETELGLA